VISNKGIGGLSVNLGDMNNFILRDIKIIRDMHKIISDLRFEQNLRIIIAEYRKRRSNTHRRQYNHKLFNIIQHDALEEKDNEKREIV
jgi:hypothetical protein